MKEFWMLLLVPFFVMCQQTNKLPPKNSAKNQPIMRNNMREEAIFANGCFWCTEAIFQELNGVDKVEPGYTGGTVEHPTYEQVSTGATQHAEALRITYDPSVISYDDLLEVFFATHDPTTLNRQGADVGTQYRSEIFYTSDVQKREADYFIAQLNLAHAFSKDVVTKVSKASTFWVAEENHWNYYKKNPNQPYCRAVISPKVQKFKALFQEELK